MQVDTRLSKRTDTCRLMMCGADAADEVTVETLLAEATSVAFTRVPTATVIQAGDVDVVILFVGDDYDASALERARRLAEADPTVPVVVVRGRR